MIWYEDPLAPIILELLDATERFGCFSNYIHIEALAYLTKAYGITQEPNDFWWQASGGPRSPSVGALLSQMHAEDVIKRKLLDGRWPSFVIADYDECNKCSYSRIPLREICGIVERLQPCLYADLVKIAEGFRRR
jgi:hypothetical protein